MLRLLIAMSIIACVRHADAQRRPVPIRCSSITFAPLQTEGDDDFGGDGPAISTAVWIYVHPQDRRYIMARVWMRAEESDKWEVPGRRKANAKHHTTAEGFSRPDYVIAIAPFPVHEIVGRQIVTHSYVDRNHEQDCFGPVGFVKSFQYVGDTKGHDVSRDLRRTKTHVTIHFKEIHVR